MIPTNTDSHEGGKTIAFPTGDPLPAGDGQRWRPDDDQIALELSDALKDKAAYFHSTWKVYEGGCWRARDGAEMRRYLRTQLRGWRGRGVAVSQNRIKALQSMLEDDLFVSDRTIIETQEKQKRYVNLRNGMFDLDTMTFTPTHKPNLYFTGQLEFDYDEDAMCPNFMRYLNSSLVLPGTDETDATLIRLMLEALGYSMTARTDLKASFWLVGAKDSGKSTFITLLKMLMGSLFTTIDLTQLGMNRFLLAGIAGKRVIAFTEANGSAVLSDALYKALVGGSDEIPADVKNKDPITIRPEAKIWWAMNEKPRITDRSGATTRRIIMIPFNRTIPETERIPNLEQLLMRERSGIFNEMVTFYQRLLRAGTFEHCVQSEERRQEYILENDTEAAYVEDRLDLHASYRVGTATLYQDYKQWCEDNGFRPKNSSQIKDEWRRFGLVEKKISTWYWSGARIKP